MYKFLIKNRYISSSLIRTIKDNLFFQNNDLNFPNKCSINIKYNISEKPTKGTILNFNLRKNKSIPCKIEKSTIQLFNNTNQKSNFKSKELHSITNFDQSLANSFEFKVKKSDQLFKNNGNSSSMFTKSILIRVH